MATEHHPWLILGTSHVGKSTCATRLGEAVGRRVVSTDKLGRHPGRPWTGVPEPVLEFYHSLSDTTLHWFLKVHHQNMRPVIHTLIAEASEGDAIILEGAALRPEFLDQWNVAPCWALCLHAEDQELRERAYRNSVYAEQPEPIQAAIDAFLRRTLLENTALVEAARGLGVPLFDTTGLSTDEVAETVLAHVAK